MIMAFGSPLKAIETYRKYYDLYRLKLDNLKKRIDELENKFISSEIKPVLEVYLLELEKMLADMALLLDQIIKTSAVLFEPELNKQNISNNTIEQISQLLRNVAQQKQQSNREHISNKKDEQNISEQLKYIEQKLRRNPETFKAYTELLKAYQNIEKQFLDTLDRVYKYIAEKEKEYLKYELKMKEKQQKLLEQFGNDEEAIKQAQIAQLLNTLVSEQSNLDNLIRMLRQQNINQYQVDPNQAVNPEYRQQFLKEAGKTIEMIDELKKESSEDEKE